MAKSSSSTKRTGSSGGTRGSNGSRKSSSPAKKGFQAQQRGVEPSRVKRGTPFTDRQTRQKKVLNSSKRDVKLMERVRKLRSRQVDRSLSAKERSRARKLEIGLYKAQKQRNALRNKLR